MKKRLRRFYSLVICFAIIAVSITALPASAIAANTVSFEDKIVFENEVFSASEYSLMEANGEEIPESVSVTLRFDESFSCEHETIDSDEELTAHRNELKAHYKTLNEKIIAQLGLKDYEDISYSSYGPFIEYNYNTYDDFIVSDYETLATKNPAAMECVYIGSDYLDKESATVATSNKQYPFRRTENNTGINTVLETIGIPENCTYDGTGVNIGILENKVSDKTINLIAGKYEEYYNPAFENVEDPDNEGESMARGSHPFAVASVLGGSSGIASDSNLYFAARASYSLLNCFDWFLENDVHVINKSTGHPTATYDSNAAFIDYMVRNAIVTFVNSAGNQRDKTENISYLTNTSTGFNVICVAANTVDLEIAKFSSYLLLNPWNGLMLKPTLTAPGCAITGVDNTSVLSGTSFSAPIVTGIIALLMERFPELKYSPEKIMAILTASCTPAAGQTLPVDQDAGFGIVNYSNAVEAYENSSYFNLSGTYSSGDLVVSRTITIPAASQTLITVFLTNNSTTDSLNTNQTPAPNFTRLTLKVENSVAPTNVISGTRLGNFCYILINNPGTAINVNVKLYCYDIKTNTEIEEGAICYYSTS